MTENTPHQGDQVRKERSPLLTSVLAVVAFALLLTPMIYLGSRMETLEERLSYAPPAVTQNGLVGGYDVDLAKSQTVYVPVYSHIYSSGGKPQLLETTISIRNSDPDHAITITSARYFDTKGGLVQDYVDGTLTLAPLETTEILIEKRDVRGGSGANFIVAWTSDEAVYEPIIEAVMVGVGEKGAISFKSPGRPLVQRFE